MGTFWGEVMPRPVNKLSALKVKNASTPGYLSDGDGLYLQVSKIGTKSWVFRYQLAGRAREMGLGSIRTFTLQEARERARRCRQLLADGVDPIAQRDVERQQQRLEAARAQTFDQCAAAYIAAHRAGWKNVKHAEQWENTLAAYASPAFGALPVADIDTAAVMRALGPIWNTKTETASRVRGRIEKVLDWATVQGFRTGENPARWRGHLDKLLPKRSKVQKVQHHPALPYAEAPAFMAKLRAQEGIAARALEFLILTATRTGEVIGARWDEFDLEAGSWTIPAERMKAGKEHEVPLSARALEIVQGLAKMRPGSYVFPGRRPRDPLSNMALLALLKRMGRSDLTAHGFRSTFSDWAHETTNFPSEVIEMALAHTIRNKVEAAYRRGNLREKRRELMDAWNVHAVGAI
jgi:integrase